MTMTHDEGVALLLEMKATGEPFVIVRPKQLSQTRREAVRKFSFQCADSQKEALCILFDAFCDRFGKQQGIDRWIRCLAEELRCSEEE